ncbi:hypothetical protein [Microtetraspora malaysiensis]|uniref:Uncharacterized protein n=1 Tax=Microtetraspora malaysiensis TaxID=161358 RepID=A0ABW6SX49_9ACTN
MLSFRTPHDRAFASALRILGDRRQLGRAAPQAPGDGDGDGDGDPSGGPSSRVPPHAPEPN